MPNTIRLKRSATAGKVPLATDLQLGELALNIRSGHNPKDPGSAQSPTVRRFVATVSSTVLASDISMGL